MKDGLVLGLAVLVLLAALTLGVAFGTEAFSPGARAFARGNMLMRRGQCRPLRSCRP